MTVQGVLRATEEEDSAGISVAMVRWAEKLPRESVVLVSGKIRKAEQEVLGTDVHGIEMDILKVRPLVTTCKVGTNTVMGSCICCPKSKAPRRGRSGTRLDLWSRNRNQRFVAR